MQMAAYIAKFAAIFVWFVWLCSNVQIVPYWVSFTDDKTENTLKFNFLSHTKDETHVCEYKI